MNNIKVFKVINTVATVLVGVGTVAKIIVGGKVEKHERLEELAKLVKENK